MMWLIVGFGPCSQPGMPAVPLCGNILVGITSEDEVWIDKRRVDVRAVRANIERLHAQNPQGAVVIQADQVAKTGLLVQVIDQARQAGVADVSIAATVR